MRARAADDASVIAIQEANELEALVTRRFPGAEAEAAFAAADSGSEGKIVIDWTA